MRLIAFILLIIGTVGLLLNELFFDWGRVATLLFAVSNLIGFATLAFSYWRTKDKK
jgi:membrane-bound ClpP family serine protease